MLRFKGGPGKAPRVGQEGRQWAGRDSYTSTEAASEDGEEDEGEGCQPEGSNAYRRDCAWGLLLERARYDFQRSMGTQPSGEESPIKAQPSRASASKEEENDGDGQSLLETILERVDRSRMAEEFLDAFHAVQRRGTVHRGGMVGMLRHWKKLSDLSGQDLTLGVGAAIAKAFHVEQWELRYRRRNKVINRSESSAGNVSLGSTPTSNSSQGQLSSKRFLTAVKEGPRGLLLEELMAVEAGAARLK
ncbi:hypothetical protein NGA_0196000, partial [Nannochloropsis gaditana CCMP526]|uniref:uncharacterized protein n=1 Tax=Nannochloropsis gaditana (strain CCMP526) TaxID=1093141 RepID=UPI00029F6CDF